ncbi:thioredoxin reductase 2, mitochondrial-like [Clavelina lepadiformis]|uniref:thioredoxin-disulfide reductase (NADPH) n=1 Tax=Clavelina lepadiformis TaxID=159417 RepID=A0ABP0FB86_CLALP
MINIQSRFLMRKVFIRWRSVQCFSVKHFSDKASPNNTWYDLVVIGGGSGGLACAKEAAGLGKKVAVLDYVDPSPQGTHWDIGGTCVNVGCIPKKLMHHASQMRHAVHCAKKYGWIAETDLQKPNWNALSNTIQQYVRSLNWGHKVQLMQRNVSYFNAKGQFVDNNTIKAIDKTKKETLICGDKIVIAVGGRPRFPLIPGAREFCMSSDDVFWRKEPLGKTLVVGGSYVGLECAGFLHGLGIDTTLMIRSIPLRGFDQQIAHLIVEHMHEEGIKIWNSQVPVQVSKINSGSLEVISQLNDGTTFANGFDTVLLAIGRLASTSELNLQNVGIKFNEENGKIFVDEFDMTNVGNIFAIGDVAVGRPELTPVAIKAGKHLARRLFDNSNELTDYNNVPTTVFTPLEYGCIGMSEEAAIAEYGIDNVEVFHAFYKPLEYVLTEQSHKQCYIKAIVLCQSPQPILGLHFVGPNSGEVVQGFGVAIKCGLTYAQLSGTTGIHPTCAEEIVKLHITKRSGLDPTVTGC